MYTALQYTDHCKGATVPDHTHYKQGASMVQAASYSDDCFKS